MKTRGKLQNLSLRKTGSSASIFLVRCIFPSGFSLIELMIASLIFITGGLCIMSLLLYAISINQQAKLDSAALHLSEQKIEELKMLPFSDSRLTAPGCSMNGKDEIDFLSGADPQHSSEVQLPLELSRGSFINYDTRWHVEDSAGGKIITVATSPHPSPFAQYHPANLRIIRTPSKNGGGYEDSHHPILLSNE
jgi:hypothetical protein